MAQRQHPSAAPGGEGVLTSSAVQDMSPRARSWQQVGDVPQLHQAAGMRGRWPHSALAVGLGGQRHRLLSVGWFGVCEPGGTLP